MSRLSLSLCFLSSLSACLSVFVSSSLFSSLLSLFPCLFYVSVLSVCLPVTVSSSFSLAPLFLSLPLFHSPRCGCVCPVSSNSHRELCWTEPSGERETVCVTSDERRSWALVVVVVVMMVVVGVTTHVTNLPNHQTNHPSVYLHHHRCHVCLRLSLCHRRLLRLHPLVLPFHRLSLLPLLPLPLCLLLLLILILLLLHLRLHVPLHHHHHRHHHHHHHHLYMLLLRVRCIQLVTTTQTLTSAPDQQRASRTSLVSTSNTLTHTQLLCVVRASSLSHTVPVHTHQHLRV